MLTITEALAAQHSNAQHKVAGMSRPVVFVVHSMLAGAYIGVAVVLMLSAAGPLRAAASPAAPLVQGLVFGVALTLVVAAGGELATSSMMTLTQGAIGRAITWGGGAAALAVTSAGNFAGAVLFAGMVHASGLVAPATPAGAMLAQLVHAKAEEPTGQLFWRGVLCNMLVCLAIWAGVRLTSESARLMVVFWCLLAFITSGYEHVVANMTTFGLAIAQGLPEATLAELARNMGVVGLGNLVGGAVLVGAAYAVGGSRSSEPGSPARTAEPLRVPATLG